MSEPELCLSLQNCQKSKTVRFAGTLRLAPHRAMSLWPRRHSQILIMQGSAWITWSSTLSLGSLSDTDYFLEPGRILDVPAGAHLVMEPRHPGQTVHFDWRELPETLMQREPDERVPSELGQQWLHALGQLGWATGQLVRGLWRPARAGRRFGWGLSRLPS
ncbi:DUF2917 domain-containing protein [Limnohabitans sp. Rim8]|uniref:DUF2917 domain-containing protein n=1 Tax=Limnohabitans sp. Rim8 TaxID=1100718 RepID=UPI00262EC216|nr:DUF2917 domain-containing protein [Limnohabitans sp. Rim8]